MYAAQRADGHFWKEGRDQESFSGKKKKKKQLVSWGKKKKEKNQPKFQVFCHTPDKMWLSAFHPNTVEEVSFDSLQTGKKNRCLLWKRRSFAAV